MNFPDLDQPRLDKIETDYNLKCLDSIPFSPTTQVRWQCNTNNHQWTASAIEVNIDQGCFQCDPQDIKTQGNGAFAQSMAVTLATLARDFDQGQLRPHAYLHDAALHITLASFFFTAVRTEFVLKVMSEKHLGLGLLRKDGKEFKTTELVDRLFDLASSNLRQFNVPHMTPLEALDKYKDLKQQVFSYVVTRNKIAHGYSKYPVSNTGNYNAAISDLIRSFGQDGLDQVYSASSKFLSISEMLLDTSSAGISAGNRILPDLFRT